MLPAGLLYGLGAAGAWGLTDIASALAGHRVGSLRVFVGAQTVGLAVLVGIAVLRTVHPFDIPPATFAYVIGLGVLGGVAYLTFFTALRIGPEGPLHVLGVHGGAVVIVVKHAVLKTDREKGFAVFKDETKRIVGIDPNPPL